MMDCEGQTKSDDFEVQAFCIGAAKSASTWLARNLDQHPEIQVSRPKEPKFFTTLTGNPYLEQSQTFRSSWEWYESCFPQQGKINIDFTVHMLPDPLAPSRVAQDFPGARFILILRDPVERAYSHYRHLMRAKKAGNPRLKDVYIQPVPLNHIFTYRSMYFKQLKPWLDYFPRERFLIVTKEEADKDPANVMWKVFNHLGVDKNFIPYNLKRRFYPGARSGPFVKKWVNAVMPGIIGRFLTRKPKLDTIVKQEYRKEFLSDINQLERTFNLDLSEWKNE